VSEAAVKTGSPLISMVVAATENDVIGRDNGMPWHLPDDLKYFKARTLGKPMLMGRKTFESIGKPLPGRTSIVMTRDVSWRPAAGIAVSGVPGAPAAVLLGAAGHASAPGAVGSRESLSGTDSGSSGASAQGVSTGAGVVVVVRSLDEALALCANVPELCAVGGAEIFRLVWPLAQRLFLTRIHATLDGDTFFPKPDPVEWRETERVEHPADGRHAYAMSFITLDRAAFPQRTG
jgi:dihydrofolate reductase